ncbi:phosphate signaling complex protein PhoU [Undibacterium sp. RTI2.1]|uniref:phosphate signaling complex protein PhoU n=1 Tax=unclassified Undibacterium TaxID=2630295 RepID=UPI002AB4E401|nr:MULTISPECIES: phosphate signaling complex protein PhoU [unclassified Undibacterium]MDY7537052.1 phosphate signaling complex protein PhoU [Undibacterium sp. 5I1]MEB0030411.1 phosphate signaling complex protein PhoU [Undibacterium sp. RTI2.1]MEB0115194.1 phosphate signaling complex protein PhoU [Undibacterium sp. RTI2.2]MEB0229230.1 phosphate signaling complex protein PhoU [Undibacterium sp. 10I3]MEB0256222.1 phosphate signaling complex protein PhoU [Undibacterium sp. 5I1]
MIGEHSSKQYDNDLETIRSKVLMMGGLVENHFHDAMSCFRTGNADQAELVIKSDLEVNRLEVLLDDMCSHLIVKRQPAANDLRTVMATGKVITDLERIGDESTKIARIARDAAANRKSVAIFSGYETVRVLASGVGEMLHQALDCFARLDGEQAVRLIAQDAIVDNDFRSIMRNLITFMMEDPSTISSSLDALWVAKAIERIGDHSKNIAEHVIYIIEGKDIRHSDYVATKQEQNN